MIILNIIVCASLNFNSFNILENSIFWQLIQSIFMNFSDPVYQCLYSGLFSSSHSIASSMYCTASLPSY